MVKMVLACQYKDTHGAYIQSDIPALGIYGLSPKAGAGINTVHDQGLLSKFFFVWSNLPASFKVIQREDKDDWEDNAVDATLHGDGLVAASSPQKTWKRSDRLSSSAPDLTFEGTLSAADRVQTSVENLSTEGFGRIVHAYYMACAYEGYTMNDGGRTAKVGDPRFWAPVGPSDDAMASQLNAEWQERINKAASINDDYMRTIALRLSQSIRSDFAQSVQASENALALYADGFGAQNMQELQHLADHPDGADAIARMYKREVQKLIDDGSGKVAMSKLGLAPVMVASGEGSAQVCVYVARLTQGALCIANEIAKRGLDDRCFLNRGISLEAYMALRPDALRCVGSANSDAAGAHTRSAWPGGILERPTFPSSGDIFAKASPGQLQSIRECMLLGTKREKTDSSGNSYFGSPGMMELKKLEIKFEGHDINNPKNVRARKNKTNKGQGITAESTDEYTDGIAASRKAFSVEPGSFTSWFHLKGPPGIERKIALADQLCKESAKPLSGKSLVDQVRSDGMELQRRVPSLNETDAEITARLLNEPLLAVNVVPEEQVGS